MAWRNGYIPEGDLVIWKRGYNETDRDWFWGLTPGTYARVLALIALAYLHTGRWLSPGDGWSTYRPLWAQEIARRIFGNGAAWPGTSSHGGFWEGRETLAIDFSNWSWVYSGDRSAFYADCWAVGLTPGMIEPRRGYPDEPWHVIDMNPRSGAPASTGPATPSEEDEIMGAVQDLQNSIDAWGAKLQAEIHDRRGVVIVWTPAEGADTLTTDDDVPRTAWVVDHGAGTKRNIHRGIDTVENALAYMKWLNDQGIPTLEGDQPPAYLAGYRDISVG